MARSPPRRPKDSRRLFVQGSLRASCCEPCGASHLPSRRLAVPATGCASPVACSRPGAARPSSRTGSARRRGSSPARCCRAGGRTTARQHSQRWVRFPLRRHTGECRLRASGPRTRRRLLRGPAQPHHEQQSRQPARHDDDQDQDHTRVVALSYSKRWHVAQDGRFPALCGDSRPCPASWRAALRRQPQYRRSTSPAASGAPGRTSTSASTRRASSILQVALMDHPAGEGGSLRARNARPASRRARRAPSGRRRGQPGGDRGPTATWRPDDEDWQPYRKRAPCWE